MNIQAGEAQITKANWPIAACGCRRRAQLTPYGTTDCQGSGVFNASGSGAECYHNGGGYNHSYHDGLGIMSADSLEGPWQSMYLPNDPSLFDTNPAPCKTCRRCFLDLG